MGGTDGRSEEGHAVIIYGTTKWSVEEVMGRCVAWKGCWAPGDGINERGNVEEEEKKEFQPNFLGLILHGTCQTSNVMQVGQTSRVLLSGCL